MSGLTSGDLAFAAVLAISSGAVGVMVGRTSRQFNAKRWFVILTSAGFLFIVLLSVLRG